MIRFESLSKSFMVRGQRKLVIDNLNLTLPTGVSLALLGRNGAGKSTLLDLIAGIFVMGLIMRQISREFSSMDTSRMTALREVE